MALLDNLILALLLTFGLQGAFFALAAIWKTDKVTDLAYGLTFMAVAAALLLKEGVSPFNLLLAAMVLAWGARLAAYLFVRITRMGTDARFDGIRERFWPFARFWLLQGAAVWLILLPVILGLSKPGGIPAASIPGALLWLAGLLIESVADIQKYRFKNDPKNRGKWIRHGLWRHSRHPNYFGELLCWWGVFLYTLPLLAGWELLAVIGPATITVLILFVTGIPPLRERLDRRHGADPAYQDYLRETRLLVPVKRLR